MSRLRHPILRHRWAAVWLIAAALLMKLVVPTGYMLGVSHGTITVQLCTGTGPVRMAMPMPGMAHHDERPDHGKTEQPCAFAGLSAPALSGADPILLVLLIAFIVAASVRVADRPVRRRHQHLRPPLRGPPARA